MKNSFYRIVTLLVAVSPSIALAADFESLVDRFVDVIKLTFPLIGGLILLVFLWAMAQYIFINSDSSSKGQAKGMIVWSLVGLFVTFSIWGIVTVLQNTFLH